MNQDDDIRDYLGKMAKAAGHDDTASWAAAAGVDPDRVAAFVGGDDIGLSDLLKLAAVSEAVFLPVPASREDEAVMLIESEGFYAEGTTPSPFDKYKDLA